MQRDDDYYITMYGIKTKDGVYSEINCVNGTLIKWNTFDFGKSIREGAPGVGTGNGFRQKRIRDIRNVVKGIIPRGFFKQIKNENVGVHFKEQLNARRIELEWITEALNCPFDNREYDDNGNIKYVGEKSTIVLDKDTMHFITCYRTDGAKLRRYQERKREYENNK